MNEQRLIKTISECLWEVACNNTHDGTLAANIHAAYNELGEQEGWLKPEYATALSEQSELVELKNINAAKGLLHYWNKIFPANNQGSNLVYSMVRCAKYKREDYEFYEKEDVLEEASNHQHNNWREFICYFEPEKLNIRKEEQYCPDTLHQVSLPYWHLTEPKKDIDRGIVQIGTKEILRRSGIIL